MKTFVLNVLIFLGVLFILAVALSLYPTQEQKTYAPVKRADIKVENVIPTPDIVKQSYMEACNIEAGLYAYCECSYDYLHTLLGDRGFTDMAVEYADTKVVTQEMRDAVVNCIHLIN